MPIQYQNCGFFIGDPFSLELFLFFCLIDGYVRDIIVKIRYLLTSILVYKSLFAVDFNFIGEVMLLLYNLLEYFIFKCLEIV